MWTLDLNDYDCNTVWHFSFSLYKQPWPKLGHLSLRQEKLRLFIANRCAEWESKSNFAIEKDRASEINDWFTSDVYEEFYAENENNGEQVERPVKQQKLDKDEV